MAFQTGDFVGVRCEVQPGPFEEERLVTVATVEGPISGFVNDTELREIDGRTEVRGKVQAVSGSIITVLFYGSFFTTNGIANITSDSAMAA